MLKKYLLFRYSALDGSFLLIREHASGEAVYTDIDPETLLVHNTDTYNIDMDGNGTMDFKFTIESAHAFTYSMSNCAYFYFIWCKPASSQDEVAGTSNSHDPIRRYPDVFLSGSMIDSNVQFSNNINPVLAFSEVFDGMQLASAGNRIAEVSNGHPKRMYRKEFIYSGYDTAIKR